MLGQLNIAKRISRYCIAAILIAISAVAWQAILSRIPTVATSDLDQFSIIVLPDTQFESTDSGSYLRQMTQWIANNKQQYGVKMVLGEGDIVNDLTSSQQWQNASAAFATLDAANIPYLLAAGNHDVINYSDKNNPLWLHPTDSDYPYNTYFPLSRYKGMPTYGGAMGVNGENVAGWEAGGVSGVDSYQIFGASGETFLAITVPFGPTNQELDWASQVIANHPQDHVILIAHDYLGDDDQIRGSRANLLGYGDGSGSTPSDACGGNLCTATTCKWYWSANASTCNLEFALANNSGGTPMPGANNGLGIWDKVVRANSNVQFVLSGHVVKPTSTINGSPVKAPEEEPYAGNGCLQGYKVSNHTQLGAKVYQLMLNCQDKNNGSGYLRILSFHPSEDSVTVKDYSPISDQLAKSYLDKTYSAKLRVGDSQTMLIRHVILDKMTDTPFWDVPDNNAFAADINWLRSAGITNGWADNTFRPTTASSRQATAAFLFRTTLEYRNGVVTGHPSCSAGNIANYFSDITDNNIFCYAINYLANKSIINKPANHKFRPNAYTSRQAMASYVAKLICYRQGRVVSDCTDYSLPQPFSDVPASSIFYGQIKYIKDFGITDGYSDGTFRGTAPISRQAMAAFIHRAYPYTSSY